MDIVDKLELFSEYAQYSLGGGDLGVIKAFTPMVRRFPKTGNSRDYTTHKGKNLSGIVAPIEIYNDPNDPRNTKAKKRKRRWTQLNSRFMI